MTNPSGVEKNHGSVSAYNATPTRSLLFNQGISADWTQEEQAILEEGLIQYASEPVINRYAKIGLLLENKTIRDVALRCTWMRTKENNKKRKEELGVARRNKEIKVTMMENPSGSQLQELSQVSQGSTSSYNAQVMIPVLEYPQGISMDWTPQEQAILDEGLAQYASEPVVLRYAKIALLLKTKTVRDVALRCRWMRRNDNSKKLRKEDFRLARKNKETKMAMEANRQDLLLENQHSASLLASNSDNVIDPNIAPSSLPIQQGLASGVRGMITSKEAVGNTYNGITAPVRHLLQQNAQAFNQISLNIATCQIHENIGLLVRSRDNIYKILNSLDEIPDMKQMPPLRIKLNEELATSILPTSPLQTKR
ncbi:hypothetical protein Leryth_003792 [Lithospermum erythrorhizon]|nr:hypothetical protein Leryth_003792 [Lithospermum erythrorhizon]